jgi:hypothetical protein
MFKKSTRFLLLSFAFVCCLVFFTPQCAGAEEMFEGIVTLSAMSVDISKGESITATINMPGNEAEYHLWAEWSVHEQGKKHVISSQAFDPGRTATATFKPTFGESGEVTFYVNGRRNTKTFAISGSPASPPLLSVNIALDKPSAQVGQPITITATGNGGNAPYEYAFFWTASKQSGETIPGIHLIHRSINSNDTYTPNDAGYNQLRVIVSVYDKDGRFAIATTDFEVIPGNPVDENIQIDISLDKDVVDVSKKESITATAKVTGLNEPYEVGIEWTVYEQGEKHFGQGKANRVTPVYTDTFTPVFGEEGMVTVNVGDMIRESLI